MERCLIYSLLVWSTLDVCIGRGGRGSRYVEPQSEQRTYPSQVKRMYYEYYINYFTPSGLRYAVSGRNNIKTVTLCSNYEPYFENGTYLGEFPCPMENDPDTFSHCCGDNGFEYCCRSIDSRSVRVGIGLGCAVVLGLTLAFVACVTMRIKDKRKYNASRKRSQQYMNDKGIPRYDDKETNNFTAKQSYDGYQILVTFRQKRFYNRFYEQLRMKYVDISWRYDDVHHVTEGKISYSEDDWVSLVMSDDFEGSPIMIVMRERSAVDWMRKEYEDIIEKIPDESRSLCLCCRPSHRNKTHPTQTREVQADDRSKVKEKDKNDNDGKTNMNGHAITDKSDDKEKVITKY